MLKLKTLFSALTGKYFRFYMGGGDAPSGQATTTTVNNTNIPDYAKPYVTNMLGATQNALFNTDPTSGNITGFKPYQPYSTDMNKYVAGFSPMQQQAFSNTANMQVSPQNAQATGMSGMAGLGGLFAGQNYMNSASDPNQIANLMSPYQQNVTDFQKRQAISDYGRQLPGMNAQAIGQGAFGGSRQAVAGAENQRNLQNSLLGIQASGTQDAYKNAQQMQQFGANLGLQGNQLANTAANTMLGAGQQDYGQQMGINAAQAAAGSQQQQLEQGKINQQIQNYATEQQYPMMQLGMMSNMIRGLPMQASTTQSYQATPSPMTQGIAGVGTALSAAKAFGASGGEVKGLAGGGDVASYSVGGAIRQQIDSMSLPQLQQVEQTTQSGEIRSYVQQRIAMMEQSQKAQGGQEQQGLPAMDSGSALESGLAGGGIIAFANEGLVPNTNPILDANDARALVPPPVAGLTPPQSTGAPGSLQATVAELEAQRARMGITGNSQAGRLAELQKQREGLGATEDSAKALKALEFFANMGTKTGSPLAAALKSASETAPGYAQLIKDQAAVRAGIADKEANIAQLVEASKLGTLKDAETMVAAEKKEKAELERTKMEIDARLKAEGIRAAAGNMAGKADAQTLAAFAAEVAKEKGLPITDPSVQTEAYRRREKAKNAIGERMEAAKAAITGKIAVNYIKELEKKLFVADEKDKPAIQADIDEAKTMLPTAAAAPAAAPSLREQALAEIASRAARK
jgi:hypothetical protein